MVQVSTGACSLVTSRHPSDMRKHFSLKIIEIKADFLLWEETGGRSCVAETQR